MIDDRTRKALARKEFRKEIRKAIQKLIEDGRIVPTGEMRPSPTTGKLQPVYVLKEMFEEMKAKKARKTGSKKDRSK